MSGFHIQNPSELKALNQQEKNGLSSPQRLETVNNWNHLSLLLPISQKSGFLIMPKKILPKTLFIYKEILEERITPAIGYLKLEQIKPIYLINFYNSLQENGVRKDGKKGGLP